MKITDSFDIGDAVIYLPTDERGEVTSINERFVFCKFWRYAHGFGYPKACNPRDLKLNGKKRMLYHFSKRN